MGLVVFLVCGLFASPANAWWDTNWKSRIQITFDNSAQAGNLVNFPVMVALNGTRIDFAKTQNLGEDIRFVDSDDLTPLDYEIEKWDEAGTSIVWVKVPQIPASSSADFIYLYYDHGSESDAQNPPAVWSNGYAAVWHLAENPSGGNAIKDSTSNLKNGVGSAGMDTTNLVAGRIGDGLYFDGTSDSVRVASNAADALAITGDFITLEALVRHNGSTAGNTWEIPFGRQLGTGITDAYLLAIYYNDPTQPHFITTGGGDANGATGQLPDLTWTYLAGVQNASNLRLYVNGSQVRQLATGGVIQTDNNDVTFGGMENATGSTINEWYVGTLDEIRISNVERLQPWVAAQHLSMADSFNTYVAPVGSCPTVSSTADSGPGTLRQCIIYANSNPGTTVIFDIPDTAPGYTTSGTESWWRISPTVANPLPTITANGTIIDGTTQAANYGSDTNSLGPEIEVNGLSAGAGVDGINFASNADSSEVYGLMVTRFTGDGIHIQNGADGITVADNWIGTDGSGLANRGNGDEGIEILGADNIIDGNVIVNSGDEGINLTGAGATDNTIIGNIIGLEPDGSSGSGNGDVGIAILTGASGTSIGGTTAAERNIISLNYEGIEVNTADNVITGNYIGTDITGTLARGNRGDDGVELQAGNNNAVGGTAAGAGNLIAYNQLRGVTVMAGTGNKILGNNIHSNNSMGIDLSDDGVSANNGTTGALPNIGMDYPVLTVSMLSGTDLHVEGYVGTAALKVAGTHIIELFKADDDGGSNGEIESGDTLNVGHGEGRWYIDRCFSDADGTFNCDLTVPGTVTLAVADSVTATATDSAGNTSEFGANYTVASSCPTVTRTGDTGPGTLRQCIAYANSNAGTTIIFDIPDTAPGYTTSGSESWWRISPASALPAITADGTVIDGTTQAANYGSNTNSLGPEIEINGASAPAGANGLVITSANNTVRNLVVNGFLASGLNGDGIQIDGAGATGNLIAGCYVGTNATGNAALGNGDEGVVIWHGASGNTIGGNDAGDRNVISGNDLMGVLISDTGTDNNVVIGNFIGTDADGTADLGNLESGVRVVLGADNNTIGGTAAGAGNVISGNDNNGIHIVDSGTSGNIVQGNYIGLDKTGLVALANSDNGIEINDANNVIGGTGAGEGNLIAFNGQDGVFVTVAGANQNLISGNSIFSNAGMGVDLAPDGVTSNNGTTGALPNIGMDYPVLTAAALTVTALHVEGYVGTSALMIAGTHTIEVFKALDDGGSDGEVELGDGRSVGHGEGELYIDSCVSAADGTFSCDLTVPGTVTLVSGDFVTATATDPADNTSEFGANLVVTPNTCPIVTTTADSGGGSLRLCIDYANVNPGTTISFNIANSDPAYISSGGNSWWRISPTGALPDITAAGTVIDGTTQAANYGSDTNSQGPEIEVDGTNAGNNRDGLVITGGIATVRSLVINRYTADAIQFEAADGNVIQDCYIGVDPTGTAALPNGADGILITATSNGNTVGGPGTGNLISGNDENGINVGSDNNVIQGNLIGTDPSGTTGLGNVGHGVLLSAASGNAVGGQGAGESNIIGFNGLDGVFITGGGTTQNLVSGNSIFSNGGLGIDLAPNGVGVGVVNNGKEAPVFASVAGTGVNTAVTVTTTDALDIIEFFRVGNGAAPAVTPDATGSGEGFLYLGACVNNGVCSGPHMISAADGDAAAGTVSATLSAAVVTVGETLTATATDSSNNTSEFAINAVYPLDLFKQAVLAADGSLITNSSTLPRGTVFKFLIYMENTGPARTDVSIRDVLDSAFAYSAGSLKVDNSASVGSSVQAIYSAVNGTAAMSDTIDADVASITGSTIDVGDRFVGNGPLDIAANRIWALLFTVRMQ